MRQWCVPAATPRTEPLPGRLSVSPPPSDTRMDCCEVEPRYTIEQIDLLQRLRLSGMTKPQIIHALESLERLDPDHRPPHCDSQPAPSNNTPTTAAPAPSSSSSSSSSLSLASATTQTSGLDGAALSPSNSYEASPPPLYTPSVVAQRSFSYDMMGEEEWDLEEKVEEYMRRDSNLVKEEIKTFLNNRRISQAIVGQVTGISQSYISQWLLQQGLEMSDSKRRAFYRWYLLEKNNPGLRWSESQHSVGSMPRARGGDRDGTVAGASGSLPNILPNPNTNLNPNPVWSRQRELLMHLLPWYAAAAAQAQPGATLSMRSLVKEEPDWRTGIMAGDRAGMVGGPLRLRRGSRFTWRKECQSIMESFFMENQYPDEAKREEIANTCNSVIQKPGCKLSEFERVTALKVYNWFANRRKEMKRRANIVCYHAQSEAAILESHGIEVPSPSCHSNGEEGEMQEFADQVNHQFPEQEETSSLKIVEQDTSTMATSEVAALPSPIPQVVDHKEEDSKRETVDEE
ncbi:homeobox-containing protein 1 isoform X1 [Cheilinus undulatus]|uniref:homeobox-containing protein 1 isoform X1 n=1 Tax=Cheilinus undulatus TaxID=241271 RepID=UPI001BD5952F|nr:homeobox-containing protein 1 isoform X1 [Cheilinus undulatus]XP_041664959.1 homeobox-containing protein 1 isoform X1 [Cheilinus undulatus]